MTVKSEENFASAELSDSASSVVSTGATGKNSTLQVEVAGLPPENILHGYSSYTYRITLFFLTAKDYNNLAANPTTFVPKYSLISSGAGFGTTIGDLVAQETRTGQANYNQTIRHPDFQTDFFIDNLSMQTIVGLNAKTKASNAVDISFTITEPYGLSLLDRLLSACETSEDASVNYMSQPYLLQIDLLASATDEKLGGYQQGNNVITTKKIAIKLIEMKIKPTGSGTTYAVRAMPFNHSAFDITSASLPVPMNIEASTVGEFFSSDEDLIKLVTGEIKADEERLEQELERWIRSNPITLTDSSSYHQRSRAPNPAEIENQRRALRAAIKFNTKSLPAAYNVWNKKIAEEKKLSSLPPTQIVFQIPDDEISKASIVNPADSSSTDSSMGNQTSGYGKTDPKFKVTQGFSFNAGTSIIDVIDAIISKSEYIKKQIKTKRSQEEITAADANYTGGNERTQDEKKPEKLKWYKIIPTVALNDFDASTNTYSKTIQYSILPYVAANSYHPNFAQVTSQNVIEQVVRTYDYLYTGKNQDIIKLDIDFDTSFYTLVTTKGDQVQRLDNDSKSDSGTQDTKKDAQGGTSRTISNPPIVTAFSGSSNKSVGTAKASDPSEQIISDMKTSIYTRQRGDALNLKLQIIGDPAFIKQDDIFINAGNLEEYEKFLTNRLANNSTRPIAENGQILFDAEQVYVQVNVKNAVDIDDSIGILNKQEILSNGRRTDGTFSGVYKVLTVASEFNRGQFTQTLDLVRIPDALDPPKKPAQNEATNQAANPASNDTLDLDAQAKRGIFANPTIPRPITPTPTPITPAQPSQAAQVKPPFSFNEAFAQARKDFGNKPGGVFEWRGKLYQTNYQNEDFVPNPIPVYPGANE